MPVTDESHGPAAYERRAAELLERDIFEWFAAGAGEERTLRDNVEAFRRRRLRPRVLVDVSEVTAATSVLGAELALPVVAAPVAFQRLVHPEGEPAMARGVAAAGAGMCVSTMASTPFAEIAAAAPGAPRWQQLYHFTDRGRTRAVVDAARDVGASALVLTVDAPVRGRPDTPPGLALPGIGAVPNVAAAMEGVAVDGLEDLISRTLSWRDLGWLVEDTGLPLFLKGILTAEDAQLACRAGVAGIVVSNHGGRQLDGVPAGIDALPEVADAVAGRAELLVDGGVRRGTDVVIALALGARAVLLGRPLIWALAVEGDAGVERLLRGLHDEIVNALTLLGCARPGDVTREHVAPLG